MAVVTSHPDPVGIAGGVQLLAPVLRGAEASAGGQPPNQQLLYNAGLATWELTFHQPAAQLMPQSGDTSHGVHLLMASKGVHRASGSGTAGRRLPRSCKYHRRMDQFGQARLCAATKRRWHGSICWQRQCCFPEWDAGDTPPHAPFSMCGAGILPGLVALVRNGAKEKVVRAGLLALAVLLHAKQPDVAPDLLDLGLHKLVAVRALQVRFMLSVPVLGSREVDRGSSSRLIEMHLHIHTPPVESVQAGRRS